MRKALFLDRDGVLNKVVKRGSAIASPRTLSEFEIVAEAQKLIETARSKNYLIIVVTNQPDVARGEMTAASLHAMHAHLQESFRIDHIEVCSSGDDADPRRKPNPGMILEAANHFGIALKESFFLGDSEKDMKAGKRAGVNTVLLETDYNRSIHGIGDYNCRTLAEVISLL